MCQHYLKLASLLLSWVLAFGLLSAQPSILWQRNIGTEQSDNALSLFTDQEGNLIIIGSEPHQDFTGNFRDYLAVTKLDPGGQQIWKSYHDVAYETFNPPYDYGLGGHFFTEEFGEKLMDLVVGINNKVYLLKLLQSTGAYYTYDEIPTRLIDVKPNNDKVYASALCSAQQACYGPDSLYVQKFDPTPDSIIFNPIKWTYQVKQNFRTAPIQGHYDFNPQDIREDANGNVYLLVQIERWDFQFCTDCNDAFVDAWCEVFKISPQGELIKHQRIAVSRAVVSFMRFVSFGQEEMIIRIDDINAAGTAIVSSIYHVDPDLNLEDHFSLGKQYPFIAVDSEDNILAATGIYDPNDPNIHGESDVLVSKFDATGQSQWKSYYGGTSFDFPQGLVVTGDTDIVFLANTQSADGDVANNLGGQDMWVVKLGAETSAIEPTHDIGSLNIYPNPVTDQLNLFDIPGKMTIELFDLNGKLVRSIEAEQGHAVMDVTMLPAGNYVLRERNGAEVMTARVVKI